MLKKQLKPKVRRKLKLALARIAIAVDSDGSVGSTPVVETNRRVSDIQVAEMVDLSELSAVRTTYIFEVSLGIPVCAVPKRTANRKRASFDSSEQPPMDEPGLGVETPL